MDELIPIIETWLENEGFNTSTLANRVDGWRKTGYFSSEHITIFIENYPDQCVVRFQDSPYICEHLTKYLQSLPSKEKNKDKEVIIKETVIMTMPCPYCNTLFAITEQRCPNCGAYVKRH